MAGQIQGFDVVMRNLNKQLEGITTRSEKGLVMGAAFVRNDTEHTSPLTPVDLGNLRASWFVVTSKSVPVGRGGAQFKGKRASQILSDHTSLVSEAQGYVAAQSGGKRKFIMAGYSVNYAAPVHEMIGANFQRPGAGPKWLESAFQRNTGKIVQIVKDNAQVK